MHLMRILPALVIALLARSSWAWNDTGHKTIALIAWADLTPAVQTRMTALLLKHPQYTSQIQTRGRTVEESQLLDSTSHGRHSSATAYHELV